MKNTLLGVLLVVSGCISSVNSQNIYSPDLSTVLDGEKWDGKFTKSHSVQYTSLSGWTWSRLRSEHPGEYEKGIEPAPNGDEWFHARIEIRKPVVKVYVNGANEPSLVVNELSDRTDGSVGIMCNGFGVIANLKIKKSE